MKTEELYEILGNIDEQYVCQSGLNRKHTAWKKTVVIAACLCVLLCGMLLPWLNLVLDHRIFPEKDAGLYVLRWENGKCYFDPQFIILADSTPDAENSVVALPKPTFSSIAEMKKRIKSGDISSEEYGRILAAFGYSKDDRESYKEWTEICDLDRLYDLKLPKDVSYDKVEWYGRDYVFILDSDSSVRGSIVCCPEEYLTECYNSSSLDAVAEKCERVLSDKKVSDRNARVLEYENTADGIKRKIISYEILRPDGVLVVEEHYDSVSASVPRSIKLYGTHHDGCFYGTLSDLPERPSVDWLTEFNLREYGLFALTWFLS